VLARSGGLSDAHVQVAGSTALAALTVIDAVLRERRLPPEIPVHLECANTVPGALVLLALIARGTTLVLVPPGSSSACPGFVGAQLRLRGDSHAAPDPLDPERCLEVTIVDAPRPLPEASPLRQGHILLRTSGSLGAPKLVAHSHAGLLANASNTVDRLALRTDDRVLVPVPLAHMYGLGAGLLPALFAGASVDILDAANLLRYLERERKRRPTVAFLTPNLCATLLRPRAAAEQYRHVVVAGDKLSPETFAAAEAIYHRVVNLYGSTEMGVIAAADARTPHGPTTVGRSLPGVALRVRPTLDGSSTGELLCAHPHGFVGYVDDSGAPLPRPEDDGWYATRDLADLAPSGELEVLGRCDHAVKRDGRLVMLADVERALERLPGVERAAAVVVGETLRGRGIVVYCTLHAAHPLDPADLRQTCRAILPAYAVPDELRVLAALPLLPGGKLDRHALHRDALASHQDADHEYGHHA
jgi:acyl-coenzyme A synthetase/AMP-(fatty) acid ligase